PLCNLFLLALNFWRITIVDRDLFSSLKTMHFWRILVMELLEMDLMLIELL
ncbi:unnamed protein product, partial [Arabidopsis halleri]